MDTIIMSDAAGHNESNHHDRRRTGASAPAQHEAAHRVLPEIDFSRPSWPVSADPGTAAGHQADPSTDRNADISTSEPTSTAPALPRGRLQTAGGLASWPYAADAWRLSHRLSRRRIDLALRLRSARAMPAAMRARFTAMGLPDDVVDDTLARINRLDGWADAWIETAQRYLGDFRRQVSAGNQIDGARNQAMAALCYHAAQIVTNPADDRTATMCRAASASLFTRALPYVYPHATRILFPWRAKSLPGYLHIPADSQAGERYGLIVILNGASSSKEESLTWSGPVVRRGFAVLALDTPGTGEAARAPFSPDQDDLLDGVFDLLAADRRLDLTQVFVTGVSQGGNTALRCAAYDRRIAGVAAITAPVNPGRWIQRISPLLADELLALTNDQPSSVMELAEALDLEATLSRISCPVLVVGAGRDMIVPPTESQILAQRLGPIATLDWFGDAGHCAYDHIGAWMADVAHWATALQEFTRSQAQPGRGRPSAEDAVAAAAFARDALRSMPLDEAPIEDEDFEGEARLLRDDEVLDDDPDWYAP